MPATQNMAGASRSPMPAAPGSRARRPSSVAATAGVRMGDATARDQALSSPPACPPLDAMTTTERVALEAWER